MMPLPWLTNSTLVIISSFTSLRSLLQLTALPLSLLYVIHVLVKLTSLNSSTTKYISLLVWDKISISAAMFSWLVLRDECLHSQWEYKNSSLYALPTIYSLYVLYLRWCVIKKTISQQIALCKKAMQTSHCCDFLQYSLC